ncbi:MAG: radical SAM protein [Bacteroidales bacterium]|jgi:wyosine [tRNA(Phe)-imidazoG37] synthetase (radical SAM superfamily)|nr:radical SAM protein [Bacteroidales bacterium]
MFLWDKIAFGPIQSRRLGNSLGINVSPTTKKICSFDCIYCECGWTLEKNIDPRDFYSVEEIAEAIEKKLQECRENHTAIDSITFSGNGEPTLHPNFCQIIDNLIVLRNNYYPQTAITCLSNATQLANKQVFSVLQKIENPVLKLDTVSEPLFQLINKPTIDISVNEIIKHLQKLKGNFILQSLFMKGTIDNQAFNNAEEPHLSLWIDMVQKQSPKQVMLYSLDRSTPAPGLEKISTEELQKIAVRLQQFRIQAKVY